MINPPGQSARHRRYLKTRGDTWRLSPKDRLSIGRFSEYWGSGGLVPPLLGWCYRDKRIPGGHWAGQGGWAGRGGLFDSKKKKNENAFLFTTTMSKTAYICICTTEKEKKILLRRSVLQLSPPFPGVLHVWLLTGTSCYRGPVRRRAGNCRDRNRDARRNGEAGADTTAAASQHGPKPWPFCSRGSNGCINFHQRGCPFCNRRKFKHCTAKLKKDGKRLLSEPA